MVADNGPGAVQSVDAGSQPEAGAGPQAKPGPAEVGRSRRELVSILLAGAVGAGLVLLGTRQELAKVAVLAPRPLPSSVTSLSGQDLRPAIAALALAALASLAAVLATRGLLRRITGLISVALGAGIALTAAAQVTRAQAVAAARNSGTAPAGGAGAGTAAGSVTAGNGGTGSGGLGISGLPVRVDLAGPEWRAVMIFGALLVAAAGVAVIARATRLPVMSARYDRPGAYEPTRLADRIRAAAGGRSAARRGPGHEDSQPASPQSAGADHAYSARADSERASSAGSGRLDAEQAGSGHASSGSAGAERPGAGQPGAERPDPERPARVRAGSSMWEALSAGEDPTAWPE